MGEATHRKQAQLLLTLDMEQQCTLVRLAVEGEASYKSAIADGADTVAN